MNSIPNHLHGWTIWGLISLFLLLGGLLAPAANHQQAFAAPSAAPVWKDVGPVAGQTLFCLDETYPSILLGQTKEGVVSTDLRTGQQSLIYPHRLEGSVCGSNGLLYGRRGFEGPAVRIQVGSGEVRTLEHLPTHSAHDGSLYVYALQYSDRRLWASSDGGLTWNERAERLPGAPTDLAVTGADGRSIYLLKVDTDAPVHGSQQPYALYFSSDAGETWEKRSEGTVSADGIGIRALPGLQTSIDLIYLTRVYSHIVTATYWLSTDGGRTFRRKPGHTRFAQTSEGLLRAGPLGHNGGPNKKSWFMERSRDNGASWEELSNLPFDYVGDLFTSPATPDDLVVSDRNHRLWYSPDAGMSWRLLTSQGLRTCPNRGILNDIRVSPYLPLTLLQCDQGRLHVLELADAGRRLTRPMPPSRVAGSHSYPETGHTLAGPFQRYWEQQGGLAQFGYPKTGLTREINAADGKAYVAQYFERNRFEYHPELAGTRYEVLLGLLGNQQTAARRAAGEKPFQPVTMTRYPDQILFAETGHTLRGAFRPYWEQHGGLALYGYPISEEFEERNPDDGKIYIVQYFERARFEWHPEFKDTQYEVLLGLLGNQLVRSKGWE